jgi:hypothetical protein
MLIGGAERVRLLGSIFAVLALALATGSSVYGQTSTAGGAQPMISEPIDETHLVVLPGNTRAEAQNPANDRGIVADNFPMTHMLLQLRRSAAQEQRLETLIDQLHDPNSTNYHQWLTATQFGAQFGLAAADIQTITAWLTQHGFTVNLVYANRMVIDFSGTAGQVQTLFHTAIHNVNVNGSARFANVSDPQIPAALAGAIAGVASLNNIPPHRYFVRKTQYTAGGGEYLMVPADLATIYNFNPLFNAGYSGQGQTIYLIEDSDLYSSGDWAAFRSTFGLSNYSSGSLNTVHPAPTTGGNNCSDPGVNSDDGEAILDAEWASAAAPSAAIVMATCANTATFGGLIAAQNLINSSSPPAIISMSYGECEASDTTGSAAFNSIFQQGVAEGTSIFVSAGDNDAAVCDNRDTENAARDGITVNGWGSSPYNVSVGGTDFSDTYSGTNASYWSSNNGSSYGSAESYVPEIPWNDSCASELIAQYVTGSSITYGSSGFCNSTTASNDDLLNIIGGSGGPSKLYSKPSWQSGFLGNPADGARDLPDVALFAANGVWGHYYVYCYSDPQNGGKPCVGAPDGWDGAGGTSFSSPIWAGIQALVNQKAGSPQGNPNPVLYALAANEYGSAIGACNASNGRAVGTSCIFYDVTLGDNDAVCVRGSTDCYDPSGTYGVLSTSTSSYAPAYTAQVGWDFATGIGTVNVSNLVNNWSSGGGQTLLTVSVTGGGTVTSGPSGISCPSTCSADFSGGTNVDLMATPASGWTLSSWGGACSGTGGCSVTMNSPQTVSATFAQVFTLSVSDSGSGTVTSSPTGVACGSTCSASFVAGTQVTLTASPANGWQFNGWSGACAGSGSCVVTMNAAESVTATFAIMTYTLTVGVSGNGTVTSSPSGINCGATCSASFDFGTPVTLSEIPAGGASFAGWSGACTGTGSCVVTMNSAQSVAATFTAGGGATSLDHSWVASTGSDSNSCDISAPCATFNGAYAKTTTGGEITCVNSADFGQLLITHAITINCENAIGSQTSAGGSNTSGITIITNTTDIVVLRGLDVDGLGLGSGGCSGALINLSGAGVLHLQKMKINHGLGSCSGVMLAAEGPLTLDVSDSDITDNGSSGTAAGIYVQPQSGVQANVTIENSRINSNYFGIVGDGTQGGTIRGTISDSVVSGDTWNGITVSSSGSSAVFIVDQTKVSDNFHGLVAGGSGAGMLVRNSSVFNNTAGLYTVNGGTLYSYGNNSVNGNNGNDGTFTGTVALQ